MRERNIFIVFEGIGGCGKDTQLPLLKDVLSKYASVFPTREHTRTTSIGILIEKTIKKVGDYEPVDPEALQTLFVADRINHTKQMILPWLNSKSEVGNICICNRYRDSTTAYAPDDKREYFRDFQKPVTLRPDLTILLDLDPEVAVTRVNTRGDADIFDKVESFVRVRKGYEWCRENTDGNYAWVDASGSIEEVHYRVLKAVEDFDII